MSKELKTAEQIIDKLKLLQISTVALEYSRLGNPVKFERCQKMRERYAQEIEAAIRKQLIGEIEKESEGHLLITLADQSWWQQFKAG